MKLRFFLVILCVLVRRASCEKRGRFSQALKGGIGSVASSANDLINSAGQRSKNLLSNATKTTTGLESVDSAATKGLEYKMKGFLEKFRERMKYGFPEIGMPSLEPFLIDEFEMVMDHPEIANLTLYIWDVEIHNLSTFRIDRAKLSLYGPTISLNISLAEMYTKGQYNMTGMVADIIPVEGAGAFEVIVYDIHITMSSSYGYKKRMYMKSFDIDFSIGSIEVHVDNFMGGERMGKIMTQVFEELAPEGIEALKSDFMPQLRDSIATRANETLKHVTIKDIISLLIGDTDGDHMNKLDTAKEPVTLKINM